MIFDSLKIGGTTEGLFWKSADGLNTFQPGDSPSCGVGGQCSQPLVAVWGTAGVGSFAPGFVSVPGGSPLALPFLPGVQETTSGKMILSVFSVFTVETVWSFLYCFLLQPKVRSTETRNCEWQNTKQYPVSGFFTLFADKKRDRVWAGNSLTCP